MTEQIKTPLQEAESLWHNPSVEQNELVARNEWLKSALNADPHRPLPVVALETQEARPRLIVSFEEGDTSQPTPDSPTKARGVWYNIMNSNGEKVGYVSVARQPSGPTPEKHFIGDIKVFEDSRGQGFGPAAYMAVLKSLPIGAGLKTNGLLSADSLRTWERLVESGVARRVDDGADPYITEFETIF